MGTHVRERESNVPSRREALCLGAAVIAMPTGVAAFASAPDPIFARIAEHRMLMEPVRDCDTTIDGEERLAELVRIADRQLALIVSTVPTTLSGILALVVHIEQATLGVDLGAMFTLDGRTFEEALLASLTAALGRLVAEGQA